MGSIVIVYNSKFILKYIRKLLFINLLIWQLGIAMAQSNPQQAVVLLHGIGLTPLFMSKIEKRLKQEGYVTYNVGYPSRQYTLEDLSKWLHGYLQKQNLQQYDQVHFVCHSMGGLLARRYQFRYPLDNMGRLVMLGPPNQGSELADILQSRLLYKLFFGPAGQQLTTTFDIAAVVGTPDYEVGVIAGNHSLIPFAYRFIYHADNDGMVSVESTRLTQAHKHVTMPVNHSFILWNKEVIEQVVSFLKTGEFREI